MACFRFMSEKWIDDALGGKFRLSSLADFRLMEIVYGDDRIGDLMEGVNHSQVTGIHFSNSEDQPELRKRLEDAKILVIEEPFAGSIMINNSLIIDQVDGYVLCFADGDFGQLQKSMCVGSYDSSIKVEDLQDFANCMYETGISGEHGPLKDILGRPEVQKVFYTNEIIDIRYQDRVKASPFLKRAKYSDQSEVRIFFPLKKKSLDEPIIIEFSPPHGMIEEVCRGVETGPDKSIAPAQFRGDAVKELLNVLDELDGLIPWSMHEPGFNSSVRDSCGRRVLVA